MNKSGAGDPHGLATNGSHFWVTDNSDNFVYHLNWTPGIGVATNNTDGFSLSSVSGNNPFPESITTNGSDFWVVDRADNFTYHVKPNGAGGVTNYSDGFSNSAFGSTGGNGIYTNGSDFWIVDGGDDFVYHVNWTVGVGKATNQSDGFSISSFGVGDPRGITFNIAAVSPVSETGI